MITLSNVSDDDGIISLSKLIGKPIKDIRCVLTDPGIDDEVVLLAFSVQFTDGSSLDFEGYQGDCFLMDCNKPEEKQSNMSQEVLSRLYEEEL